MTERPHKKLKVWQESVELAKLIYAVTEEFPTSEKFGLVMQMRRAAVSIASNIAEGSARMSNREKLQFYGVARGSLSELDTQIEISRQLGFLKKQSGVADKMDSVGLLLYGLIESRRRAL